MRTAAARVLVAGALLGATGGLIGTAAPVGALSTADPPAPVPCGDDPVGALLCELLRQALPLPPSPAGPPVRPGPFPRPAPSPVPAAAAPAPAAEPAAAPAPAPPASDPFLLQLLDLLSHRSAARPSLLHFRPPEVVPVASGEPPAVVGACPGREGRCLPAEVPMRAGAAGMVLLLGAAVLLTGDLAALRRRTAWRPLLALAGACTAGTAVALLPGGAATAAPATSLGGAVAAAAMQLRPTPANPPAQVTPVAPAVAAGPWERLVELERRIASRADPAALASEDDLYRRAVADPSTRALLVSGATGSHIPGAAAAVLGNLEAIGAAVAEEAVVADAQARLAGYGGLQPAQLQAIEDHQPLMVPLVAPVTQWFGPSGLWMEPAEVYHGVFYPHFHTGIDLAAPFDTPIHAAADGVVLSAGTSTDGAGRTVGYGTYVVIAHSSEVITLYGHLDRLAVAAGDQLHQGQVIGLEGSTGMSTGPHLHFELREGGVAVDPKPYLGTQLDTTG